MKRILIFLLMLFPVLTYSQKKLTAEKVFDKFYSDNLYSYFEISSELLKDIVNSNKIDDKSKEKLLKIKSIRMIELDTTNLENKKRRYAKVIRDSKFPVIYKDYDKYSYFFINFTKDLYLKPYKVLILYKKKGNSKMFLKQELGTNNREYLLVTDLYAIQIIGDVNLNTISDLQKIVDQLSKMTF